MRQTHNVGVTGGRWRGTVVGVIAAYNTPLRGDGQMGVGGVEFVATSTAAEGSGGGGVTRGTAVAALLR